MNKYHSRTSINNLVKIVVETFKKNNPYIGMRGKDNEKV